MADRLREHFAGALPVQCIVNEYRPGQGIGMHADHRDFGPVVASLSLAADWPMRFRPRSVRPYARGGLPGDEVAVLPRRSVLVLAGSARRDWMHGIDPRRHRRRGRDAPLRHLPHPRAIALGRPAAVPTSHPRFARAARLPQRPEAEAGRYRASRMA